jgi:hypothetical protein
MATKYTKGPKNRPKGHKIYQHLPLQDPPTFKIGIFGLEICYLATVVHSETINGIGFDE